MDHGAGSDDEVNLIDSDDDLSPAIARGNRSPSNDRTRKVEEFLDQQNDSPPMIGEVGAEMPMQ